jgi:hypothetical protein
VRRAALLLMLLCPLALSACGDTLQDKPIPHNILEGLVVAPFPVYWAGGTFQGMAITEASSDPSGSIDVQYGDCLEGGQGTCLPRLRVITSPDNSFLPGGSAATQPAQLRGIRATIGQGGNTILIPTGPVVVSIYANSPALARAAARMVVPINEPSAPGGPLQAPQPDSGYGSTPLFSQEPTPLHPLH